MSIEKINGAQFGGVGEDELRGVLQLKGTM